LTRRIVPAGIVMATGVGDVPGAMLGGWWVLRRGAAARILAGETGKLRLTTSLNVEPTDCDQSATARGTSTVPALPRFVPRSQRGKDRIPADPINLILIGDTNDVDSAFHRAGWTGSARGSVGAVTKEIVAGLTNHQAIGAPLSTQYFEGRRQDLAYQLSGPNALMRHHVRIWQLDSAAAMWVGAANEDVGLKVNPLKGRFTHRISPMLDLERDRIVQELEATGCADLLGYVEMPGAVKEGRNANAQRFTTDGRSAVIAVNRCATP
jgi:hypothetical protein